MATAKKLKQQTLDLQAPWILYGKKIIMFFDKDPEITITEDYTGSSYKLIFDSENTTKLTALHKLLRNYFNFGNVSFCIEFAGIDVTDDESPEVITAQDWIDAFSGNYYFLRVTGGSAQVGPFYTYAIFRRSIIDIYADDLLDYCGNEHFIAADLVRSIVVSNCTLQPCTSAI